MHNQTKSKICVCEYVRIVPPSKKPVNRANSGPYVRLRVALQSSTG